MKAITAVILLAIMLFMLAPLWWAICLSFDETAIFVLPRFSLLPHKPSLFNYKLANATADLARNFANTIFISIVNTVTSVFFALCCGYAFAKGRFHGKRLWYFVFLSVMMLPFEARLIPLFMQYKSWGTLNTYWPLILGNFCYAYGIFFARNNIAAIPDSLREAALIDGAGEWKIFLTIIVPLSKPLIASLSILQIISNWNSYLWPLVILRDRSMQLISNAISLINVTGIAGVSGEGYGPKMAVAVIGSVPLIVMFLFLQKYIVQSVALSGIKQ